MRDLSFKHVIPFVLLTMSLSLSCKKDQPASLLNNEAIIGKWFWEKQDYGDRVDTDFYPTNYFSFDNNGIFIEFNGSREIPGTYRLSLNQDTLFTKRPSYAEEKWIIRKLDNEFLVIEHPGYTYTLSKKLGKPNSYIEISVKEIINKGTSSASITAASDATVSVYSDRNAFLSNKPSYQGRSDVSGKAKIKVPDRTRYLISVVKGTSTITTSDGFLIGGVFLSTDEINNSYVQTDAKVGDLIKQDLNADGILSDDDKQAYYSIWSGKKSEVVSMDIYISQ